MTLRRRLPSPRRTPTLSPRATRWTCRRGENLVTVTVTAPEGDTQDYTVSVNQGVTDVAGWKAGADLDGLIAAGNNDPYGIWSGRDDHVGGGTSKKSGSTPTICPTGRETTAGTSGCTLPTMGRRGVWSDGMTIWVADVADSKVYAYRLSDGMRQPDRDINGLFNAGNTAAEGIWSDGTTMWVADYFDNKGLRLPSVRWDATARPGLRYEF